MADQELPDFNTMAASHTTMAAHLDYISHEHASMAAQLGRMANVPAFDAGAQILDAIAKLSRRVDEHFDGTNRRFDEITQRLDSMYRKHSLCIDITSFREFNSMARIINAHAIHPSIPLSPLRNAQNEEVANFPVNGAAIDALNGQLHGLLALIA